MSVKESTANTETVRSLKHFGFGAYKLSDVRGARFTEPWKIKHGLYGTRTWNSWRSMKRRCNEKSNASYETYKNIKVCKRWMINFINFFEDMGQAPTEKHTIERIDSGKGYNKKNCKWATQKEQARNRSNNSLIEFENKKLCLAEWEEVTGIPQDVLRQRKKSGWEARKILTTLHKIRRSPCQ